jgi:N-acetylglucosamine-6-phosphate deacetylase
VATLAIRNAIGGDVFVEGPVEATIDATGCRVVPGFVDLQCNGGWGVDFTTEPERAAEVAARLPETGVTAFCPTIITAPPDVMLHAIKVLDLLRHSSPGARSLGVHVEGPFLNPGRAGAHPVRHIRPPSREEAGQWAATGGVAMVTLAPELHGAFDVITHLTSRGIVVSCGHSEISVPVLEEAVRVGVTAATHLYNAMGSMSARMPGTAGAVLANRSLYVGLIADGLHVDPAMVSIAFKALGSRLFLVSDAISALGLEPGTHRIGGMEVTVGEGGPRTADGVLAGSVLRMDEAVRNLAAFTGCSIDEAIAAASTIPASVLGVSQDDRVLLDADNRVAATVISGQVVFDRDGRAG